MDIKRTTQQWLDAFSDPRSYLYTFSRCMALADLQGDGDYKLVLADLGTGTSNIKLKVYKGVSLMSENTLLEMPTALVTFYHDQQEQKIPAIALSSGSSIYIYKNMKPYYKFSLPELEINALEMDLWDQARNDDIKPSVLHNMLETIKNEIGFSNLSFQSQKFLMLPVHKEEELQKEAKLRSSQTLRRQTVITTMTTLYKSRNLPNSVSCLVIGTENGCIHIIDSEAFTILDSVNQSCALHSTDQTVPVVIKSIGLYDVDYRIVVYNRNGKITLLRRGWTQPKIILELSIQAVDLCLLPDSGNIFLALMDSFLECYSKKDGLKVHFCRIHMPHMAATTSLAKALVLTYTQYAPFIFAFLAKLLSFFKMSLIAPSTASDAGPIGVPRGGKKLWNVKMSSNVTGLLPVPLLHHGVTLIAVALEGGTICFYNNQEKVDVIMAADTIAGMVFGRLGQEEHCLVLNTISGTFQVKVLKRTAQFSQHSLAGPTSSTNQNVKLKISKKTSIFLDQAAYEMNNCVQMHQKFQSELFRFRLETFREFYESLSKKSNSISNDSKLPLKLSAEVFGIGPTFKILLTLENMSQTPEYIDALINKTLGIVFHYNDKIYRLNKSHLHVPLLVPGLVYKFETKVQTVTEVMVSEEIRVFVTSPNETKPILSTVVYMPICDVLPIEI